MSTITISAPTKFLKGKILLPLSKSLSNRALMISAISGGIVDPGELSDADDTVLLQKLLQQIDNKKNPILNARNAGTVFRFLTAYLAITPGEWILEGDERMRQRPIGPIVNALQELGAEIKYLGKNGFPPLQISGKTLKGGSVSIDPGMSSQYISALMMIGPMLEDGLILGLKNTSPSIPYILLTSNLMKMAGAEANLAFPIIHVPGNGYKESELFGEADWSSAAYWYQVMALSEGGDLFLNGLRENSKQGDRKLTKYFKMLGVETQYEDGGVRIHKTRTDKLYINIDLSSNPDLAPSLIVTSAALGYDGYFLGLSALRIKESDRLEALATELGKAGINCTVYDDELSFEPQKMNITSPFNTYNDHRLAMAFAPLAALGDPVTINNAEVVSKSYPVFWSELQKVLGVEF